MGGVERGNRGWGGGKGQRRLPTDEIDAFRKEGRETDHNGMVPSCGFTHRTPVTAQTYTEWPDNIRVDT